MSSLSDLGGPRAMWALPIAPVKDNPAYHVFLPTCISSHSQKEHTWADTEAKDCQNAVSCDTCLGVNTWCRLVFQSYKFDFQRKSPLELRTLDENSWCWAMTGDHVLGTNLKTQGSLQRRRMEQRVISLEAEERKTTSILAAVYFSWAPACTWCLALKS